MVVLLPCIGSGADCLATGSRPSTSGAARSRGEDLSAAMSWSEYLNAANPAVYGVAKPPEPDSEALLAAVTAADAQARPATTGQSSSRFKAAAKTMETARRRSIEVGGFSMLRDLEVRARVRARGRVWGRLQTTRARAEGRGFGRARAPSSPQGLTRAPAPRAPRRIRSI